MISLQHLNEHRIIRPHILNIMRPRFRNISAIPRVLPFSISTTLLDKWGESHIVKRSRIPLRRIDPNLRTPTYKEILLVTRGMPMNFPMPPALLSQSPH